MHHRSGTSDDAQAVRLVLSGDKEAFVGLLRRHHTSVLGLCTRILGSENDAQDVAQEAALRAFLGLGTLRDPGRFGAWLHSIAANLARLALRRRRRAASLESFRRLPAEHGTDVSHDQTFDRWLADESPGPEEVRLARELHDDVLEAIRGLSIPNREAVVGYYLQGYSQAELAELLGVSVGAIKGRLHESRKRLRPVLEPVARQVLGAHGWKEKAMDEVRMVEIVVDDALKMPFDDERGLEMIRSGGSLRDLRDLASPEAQTSLPAIAVVLEEVDGARVLPIWVGLSEGLSIWGSISGARMPRPMAHDLMRELLGATELEVQSVAVMRLAERTFYGEIALRQRNGDGGRDHRVDSRPSDAIALAVRLHAPIYVSEAVLEEAAFESKEALLDAQREGRGHFARYTLLVDLELHKVVDLLPERSQESLLAWFERHPGAAEVEVAARDCSNIYREGLAKGAPKATHVAVAKLAGTCSTTSRSRWRNTC